MLYIINLLMSELRAFDSENEHSKNHFYYQILGDEPMNIDDEVHQEKADFNRKIESYLNEILPFQKCSKPPDVEIIKNPEDLTELYLKKESKSTNSNSEKVERNMKTLILINKSKQDSLSTLPKTPIFKKKIKKILVGQEKNAIFKECPIRRRTKKFAISKFLVRMFLKYREQFEGSSQVRQFNQLLNQYFQQCHHNKFNMERDMAMILGSTSDSRNNGVNIANRTIMWNILKTQMKEDVIMNSFTEKNRLSYMIAMKVYMIRCRSRSLSKKGGFR